MDKKGEEPLIENIIFLILNLIVFVMLLFFINGGANGKYVQEQYYAKQIAYLINEASPEMVLYLNIDSLYEKYDKEFKTNAIVKENILKIDNEKGLVYFSLNSQSYYSYPFFNKVKVTNYLEGEYLILKIEEIEKT